MDEATRTNPADSVGGNSKTHAARFSTGMMLAERYRIVGRIGQGGMGDVYRAEDVKLGVSVALKFLPDALAHDPNRLSRFHGEVRHARSVSHANVCRVYDIGEADGQTFITMEYVDGEDLATLLRRIGRLSGDKAVEFMRQICLGVAAAHEAGILHRDLKPANIMIDGRGKVRITDFGLAGVTEELRGREFRAGTPAYMAPEQLERGAVSQRSDIYALGLVLYEMVTGKRTFNGKSVEDYTRLHRSETPTHPSSLISEIDPAVERVILRCLEKDPAARPTSALAVAAALPGGDPLAAVLAAGETPSPELVAAAGANEGLPPGVAAGCLTFVLLALLGFVFLAAPKSLLNNVPADEPPQVLAAHAQELLASLGLRDADADTAFGYQRDPGVFERIRDASTDKWRWNELADARPAAVSFWYRQAPDGLVPPNEPLQVTATHPPNTEPGMVSLRFDLNGRLEFLHRVPTVDVDEEPGEVTYARLFGEAGLDIEQFEPTTPRHNPPDYCDDWQAWNTSDESADPCLYVECGLLHMRPVYFEIARSAAADAAAAGGADEGPASGPSEARKQQAGAIQQGISIGLALGAFALSCFMAWRNIKLNRGDRRGAFRLAMFAFLLQLGMWVLIGANGGSAGNFLTLLFRMSAYAVLFSMFTWLGYMAIEPYVRKRWPTVMIGWTRLLAGRFADPLVGRDVLVGSVFGVIWAWLFLVPFGYAAVSGTAPPAPALGLVNAQFLSAMGPAGWVAIGLSNVVNTLLSTIMVLLILFVSRAVFRIPWLAVAMFLLLFVVLYGLRAINNGGFGIPENVATLVRNVALIGTLTLALLRYGFLAASVGNVVGGLLIAYPITVNPSAWYFGATGFAVIVALAVAGFAFHTSRAGQPVFARDLLES